MPPAPLPTPPPAPTLDEAERRAWRGLLEVHSALTQALDAQLRSVHGLPLSSYQVLTALAGAPGERLRMADIADLVLLSRSGLTRVVDRLVALGLVERCACPDDGRGQFARLTAAGHERHLAARSTHRDGVRRFFLARLADGDAERLVGIWQRILGRDG